MTLPHEPADNDEQYDDPSRGRKRRIMGVSIALVVVVGLVLLTGLAWPGWFSSNEKTAKVASSAGSGSTASPTSSSDIGEGSSADHPSEPAKPPKPGREASEAAGDASGQGGATASPARVAAQAYADAVNAKDANKMVAMVCDLTKVEKYTYIKYFDKQFSSASARVTLVGPTKMKGNFAVTRAHSKASARGRTKSEDIVVSMQKKGGRWCVPSRA